MNSFDFGPPDPEALEDIFVAHEQFDPPDTPVILLSVIPPEEGETSESL